jgi:hypothetical protein
VNDLPCLLHFTRGKDLEVVLDVTIYTAMYCAHIMCIHLNIAVQLIAHFTILCNYSRYDFQSRGAMVDKIDHDAYWNMILTLTLLYQFFFFSDV